MIYLTDLFFIFWNFLDLRIIYMFFLKNKHEKISIYVFFILNNSNNNNNNNWKVILIEIHTRFL